MPFLTASRSPANSHDVSSSRPDRVRGGLQLGAPVGPLQSVGYRRVVARGGAATAHPLDRLGRELLKLNGQLGVAGRVHDRVQVTVGAEGRREFMAAAAQQ